MIIFLEYRRAVPFFPLSSFLIERQFSRGFRSHRKIKNVLSLYQHLHSLFTVINVNRLAQPLLPCRRGKDISCFRYPDGLSRQPL